MQSFRRRYIRVMIIFVSGATFLNLGFLQVEVTLLRDNRNLKLIENIADLLSTAAPEEEASGESEDNSASEKEVDLISHQSILDHANFYILSQKKKWLTDDALLHHNYLKKFSPPPEG